MSESTISDGKIHILYLVRSAPGVSYQMLMDACLRSLYLDFFTFSQCYSELIAGNLLDRSITETGTGEVIGTNETLTITKGGLAILEDVESTLNLQTLGYLKKAAAELKETLDEKNSVKAFISPVEGTENNYELTLETHREGKDFRCTFTIEGEEKAKKIQSTWLYGGDGLTQKFVDELLKM